MKTNKKFLSLLLAFCLMLGAMPMTAMAAEPEKVLELEEALDISALAETTDMLEEQGWKWEPAASGDGGTLTLQNCHIRCTDTGDGAVLKLPSGNVTILLEGENTLETVYTNWDGMIVEADWSSKSILHLTIREGKEGGRLNLLRGNTEQTSGNPYGISGESLTILSGDIYTNTDLCMVDEFDMQDGSLTVDAANVTDCTGIYADLGVDISGGVVTIKSGSAGIFVPGIAQGGDKTVAITGGEVTISSAVGINGNSVLIDTDGSVDITGSKAALALTKGKNGRLDILSAGEIRIQGDISMNGNPGEPNIAAADYKRVDDAVAAVKALKQEDYMDFSAVSQAVGTVIWDKNLLQQAEVDAMAKAIEDAVAALEYKPADYSGVEEAVAKAGNLNKDDYKDFSAVEKAVAAVIEGKNITEQAEVDAMARAIEDAVAALEYKSADYSRVDAAIEKAEALNKDDFKDFTAVEEAIVGVVREKNITQQAEVDVMAKAIEDALAALEEKTPGASGEEDTAEPDVPQTGGSSNLYLCLALLLVSGGTILTLTVRRKKQRG